MGVGALMDWRATADQHGLTIEDIKEKLPLEWVIGVAAGIQLEEQGEGRAVGICPFHDDEDPSLDVYGYGIKWGCFPCGKGGDLFDFIGDFWELDSFAARFERSIDLYGKYQKEDADEGWTGVTKSVGIEPVVSDAEVLADIESAQLSAANVQYPIAQLLQKKGLDIPTLWLIKEWDLGVTEDMDVLAPYMDYEGVTVSYKTRSPGRGGWYARKGRKLTALYGEWKLKDEHRVWLCEGETDTWLASFLVRGRGVALGLPRGAGANVDERFIELLTGRHVTIVFDADVAGRRAARKWHAALKHVAQEVHIAQPDSDLCDSGNPLRVLESGQTVNDVTGFIQERPDRLAYQQVTRSGAGEAINNWVFDPTKFIKYLALNGKEDQRGFEGHFANDTTHKRLITDNDLYNAGTAIKWSNKNGRVWFGGGQKWSQCVLDELNAQAPFLPTINAVSMVGLHGVDEGTPTFVIPGDVGTVIGTDLARERWIHYPGGTLNDYSDNYSLPDETLDQVTLSTWGFPVVQAMMTLNKPSVTTPIIAWLCAAPLRSLCHEFPSLGVVGGSGSGKTTMLGAMLKTFYGVDHEHNLSKGSTVYGITSWAFGSNGLPVWYDEYRNAAPRENLEAMDQLLRDAWTASSSSRGGMKEDKAKVVEVRVTAPLIVSGESAFTERSHIDRVLVINMPDAKDKSGMNVDAMGALMNVMGVPGRLGRVYLDWLMWRLGDGGLPDLEIALDRQTQGENVARWGWKLWVQFNSEVLGLEIAPNGLDLRNIRGERERSDEHPVLSALADALDGAWTDIDKLPIAWVVGAGDGVKLSEIAVRVLAFHRGAELRGFVMPGNDKATRNWLMGRFTVRAASGRVDYPSLAGWETRKQCNGMYVVGVMEAITEELVRSESIVTD